MNTRFLPFFSLCLGVATGPLAHGAAADEPEKLPDAAEVVSLSVEPAAISLARPTDYVQVLVTAKLKSGDTVDVTRAAKLGIPGGAAVANELGMVTPGHDGTGELSAVFGQVSAKAAVAVKGVGAAPAPEQVGEMDYVRDVMPIMSKMGCNSGTCHGSKEGRNGFKLSLRGYDPVYDIRALTDDLAGRRVNVAFPDSSVMLLKPTAAVPHEGGQVMKVGDKYYNMLRSWIAAGAQVKHDAPRVTGIEVLPKDPVVQMIGAKQQMRVVATYAGGVKRDVTAEAYVESGNIDVARHDKKALITTLRRGEAPVLARFEGAYAATTVTVMGDRTGFVWQAPPANNEIDKFVAAKLERTKTAATGLCTDLEFIRRIYLDLTGLPPTPDQVRGFIADARDSRWKRDILIDSLIGSEGNIEHWTSKWADLLQVNSKFLGREGADAFRKWIRTEVAANTPYDQFARKVLTATGSNKENPAASYFKILRTPEDTMENTTHLWLATRFNCNKCHDHPFERWTQDQYYQMSAFFAQVDLQRDPASGDRNLGGSAVEGAKPLYELVIDKKDGEQKHLRTGKVAPPTFPYSAKAAANEDAPRREKLAAWISSADNQYFAKSHVNRTWGYLTGTGIIEPLDDIRAGNPPSNPELLEWLTRQFVESGFDTRKLVALICKSRTYQLSIQTSQWNQDDTINFSHAKARRLPAEVLYDTIYASAGALSKFPGMPPGTRAAALPDPSIKLPDGFLGNLGQPVRESTCECERSHDLQLGPIMALVSGPTVGDALSDPASALTKLVASEPDDRRLVDELFMRFLSRPATGVEATASLETMHEMDAVHAQLGDSLKKAEAQQAPVLAEKEAARKAAMETAQAAVTAREQEIAAKVAADEKARQEKIAAAQAAVAAAEAAVPQKLAAWEGGQKGQTGWVALEPGEMKSKNKAKLEKQPDNSIFVSGAEGKTTYTVTAPIKLATLTGLRLEALTDERLGGRGPGRSGGGNFVLTEIEAEWTADGAGQKPVPVKFKDALASFSQVGYDVKTAIDGNEADTNNGWAVYPDGAGREETAIFTTGGEAVPVGPGQLTIKLKQQYTDGKHTLGRFRLSVTNDPGALTLGLPAPVVQVLAVAPAARTPDQQKTLVEFYKGLDPEVRKLQDALKQAMVPPPADAPLATLKAALAKASEPVAIDAKLARLRQDVDLSRQQLTNRRLTAAQDIAWALVNNPAFLFNR